MADTPTASYIIANVALIDVSTYQSVVHIYMISNQFIEVVQYTV